ncbi:MAG TPA: alpha/beta hydrolase-fold protein [Friedmanniella sp.]
MLAPAAPSVVDGRVTWRVGDHEGRLDGVRLWTDFDLGDTSFRRVDGGWELVLAQAGLPPVDRLEYLLEETRDGYTVRVTDPANPRRVGGAFGDHSVASLGYHEPAWLGLTPAPGTRRDLVVEGTVVGGVAVQVWSPEGTDPDEVLPLLLSHDGPEMDHLGELTRFVGVMTALRQIQGSGGLAPVRVGLLAPGPRDERYSANPAYAAALCTSVVPALLAEVPTVGRPVLMGQSLGALAALHAEWRHPGTFGGLLLQSGSFFTPQLDAHEAHHGGWNRITGFVAEVLDATRAPSTPGVVVCFGTAEENAANNRGLAAALDRLGVPVRLGEVRDGHTWTCWRDLLDPHLLDVLRQAHGTGPG